MRAYGSYPSLFQRGGGKEREYRGKETAVPSTTLLGSSGRDDKERAVILRKGSDLDGWS